LHVPHINPEQALRSNPAVAGLDPSPPQDWYSCTALKAAWEAEQYKSSSSSSKVSSEDCHPPPLTRKMLGVDPISSNSSSGSSSSNTGSSRIAKKVRRCSSPAASGQGVRSFSPASCLDFYAPHSYPVSAAAADWGCGRGGSTNCTKSAISLREVTSAGCNL
jgi:hypothetical protein